MYALIMAGGTGTRLWPRSRSNHPKQFLPLLGERTMLQETADRILPLVWPDQIIVVTGQRYVDLAREQLPEVPRSNLIGEPSGKGSAPAIGLGAITMLRTDPNATMVVLSSDHQIQKVDIFRNALTAAEELAQQGYLVTLGIQPTEPQTGYGYVQRSSEIGTFNGFPAYAVERFAEKPSREKASEYVKSGQYSWNAGIFIWRAEAIMQAFAEHMPQLRRQLAEIDAAGGASDPAAYLNIWERIENTTIDYGIMERAQRVAVIPVDIGWSDVGDWDSLAELGSSDGGNLVQARHVGIDTTGTLIHSDSDRLVATIGLDSYLVIDTGDVVLIAPRNRAQDVKKIVDELKRQGRTELL